MASGTASGSALAAGGAGVRESWAEDLHPRDDHGKFSHAAARALRHLRKDLADAHEAKTGQAALDAVPAKFTPDPHWASGHLDGASLAGPGGHGSARALAEYQGLEYVSTNTMLRSEHRMPPDIQRRLKSDPAFAAEHAARRRVVNERAAEIDKTMHASRTAKPIVVHRVVKDAPTAFRSAWYGDVDPDEWDAGKRPDLTGMEWREDAYVSTTVDPEVVDHYVKRGSEPVVLNISVPKGTGAVQLSGVGDGGEGEVLLQRGLRMRVVGDSTDEQGRRVLDVEAIHG